MSVIFFVLSLFSEVSNAKGKQEGRALELKLFFFNDYKTYFAFLSIKTSVFNNICLCKTLIQQILSLV